MPLINKVRQQFQHFLGPNLAFTLVIALAYLATFTSSAKRFSSFDIALLLVLGLIYVIIGIGDFQILKRFGARVETWLYFLIEIPLGMLIQYLFGYTAVSWLILIPLSASVVMLLQGVWVWVMGLAIVAALVVPIHGELEYSCAKRSRFRGSGAFRDSIYSGCSARAESAGRGRTAGGTTGRG